MLKIFNKYFLFFILCTSLCSGFENQLEQELFSKLLCPVCSGQSLFESNHPVATAIKLEIHEMAQDGWSKEEIIFFLKNKYSSKILPTRYPSKSIGVVLIGIVIFIFFNKKFRNFSHAE